MTQRSRPHSPPSEVLPLSLGLNEVILPDAEVTKSHIKPHERNPLLHYSRISFRFISITRKTTEVVNSTAVLLLNSHQLYTRSALTDKPAVMSLKSGKIYLLPPAVNQQWGL